MTLLKTRKLRAGLATACIAFLAACTPSDEQSAPSEPIIRPVKVIVVEEARLSIERSYAAQVLPADEAELSFRVSGKLAELNANAGRQVNEGDVIAQLDTRDFEAEITRVESQLDQANAQLTSLTSGARAEDIAALEAGVAASQAQVDAAASALARAETLLERQVTTKANVEDAQTALRVAQADLEAKQQELAKGQIGARAEEVAAQEAVIRGLESNLQSLRDNLSDTTLRAPFTGIIAARAVENFANVQANATIATLQKLEDPDLIFDIPAPDIPVLAKNGSRKFVAKLDGLPDNDFAATESEFSTKADPATQTYRGRVTIQNPDNEPILPGMTGTVTVSVGSDGSASISVPATTVVADASGSPYVWLVAPDGKSVSQHPVKTGTASGSDITISEGLAAGDRIAAAGLSALQDGMAIKPVTEIGD